MKFYHKLILGRNCSLYYSTKAEVAKKIKWESVIGLEVHAQIDSKTKLFSNSFYNYGSPVNTQVSFFDAGHPGTLPVLNKKCVEAGVLTSLALGCTVHKKSMFDRKHYFYADLPVGYQITQQRFPIATNGVLKYVVYNHMKKNMKPYESEVRIKQIQLEQDSGKSIHDEKASCSLIDLNRAGVALMEIVFEPDVKTSDEAASLLDELILIFSKLGTCNCKMEEGALRVDVNVSVNKTGEELGVRTEIKNLYSTRAVVNAIESEIVRQIALLENGHVIENETRSFDSQLKKTISMRDKEKVQDYRFMPEPNLPPLLLCDDKNIQKDLINIDALRRRLPDLPSKTRQNLMKSYDLTFEVANQIIQEDFLLDCFNFLIQSGIPLKRILTFLLTQMFNSLRCHNVEISKCPINRESMFQLLKMEADHIITNATLLQLIEIMVCGDRRLPKEIVDANNWYKIQDKEQLEKLCKDVINDNVDLMTSRKKKRLYNELVTKVREHSDNRADLKIVCEIIDKLLSEK